MTPNRPSVRLLINHPVGATEAGAVNKNELTIQVKDLSIIGGGVHFEVYHKGCEWTESPVFSGRKLDNGNFAGSLNGIKQWFGGADLESFVVGVLENFM